jgi:hypothetical protein
MAAVPSGHSLDSTPHCTQIKKQLKKGRSEDFLQFSGPKSLVLFSTFNVGNTKVVKIKYHIHNHDSCD